MLLDFGCDSVGVGNTDISKVEIRTNLVDKEAIVFLFCRSIFFLKGAGEVRTFIVFKRGIGGVSHYSN